MRSHSGAYTDSSFATCLCEEDHILGTVADESRGVLRFLPSIMFFTATFSLYLVNKLNHKAGCLNVVPRWLSTLREPVRKRVLALVGTL